MNFEEFRDRYQKVPVEEFPNRVLEAVPAPEVSVRISTYQHAPYIRECVEGILMQETEFPFEILIGEDESTDGTREICIEYAKQHPDKIRLFLHRRENNIKIDGRPTGNFQTTYTRFMARGKYQAICEGDDFWVNPNKLALQFEFMENNPTYSMCGGITKAINLSYPDHSYLIKPKAIKNFYGISDIIASYFLHTSTFFMRSSLWNSQEWKLNLIAGDHLTLAENAKSGPIGFINQLFSVYRMHEGGLWSGNSPMANYSHAVAARESLKSVFGQEFHSLIDRDLYRWGIKYFEICINSGYYLNSFQIFVSTYKKVNSCYKLYLVKWPFLFFWYLCKKLYYNRKKLGIRTKFRSLIG